MVIPRGTTYRFRFDPPQRWLTFYTPGEIETPNRYRNRYGQLLEHAPPEDGITGGLEVHRVREPVHVRVRHPLLEHDLLEGPDLLHAAGRKQVVEDRLVAGEALEAHDLLDQQRRGAVARGGGRGVAELDVALLRDLAQAVVTHQRFPLSSCSRSIASKSALKLPLPKPREPCRSISSKKTVGRSPVGLVKICSR